MQPNHSFLRKGRKRVLIIAFGLAALWWITFPWPFAAARGRFAARLDLALGNCRILRYGLHMADREYTELLKERYGIGSKRVADCIVSEPLVEYADNYNAVSMATAKQKYGHDIFSECLQKAKQKREKHATEIRKAEFTSSGFPKAIPFFARPIL